MIRNLKYSFILIAVLLFALFPNFANNYANTVSLLLIIVAGIPHGAADHIIFSKIGKKFFGANSIPSFISIYLLLAIGFIIIWSISPLKALILFILISIYHFGQEHFEYLDSEKWLTKLNVFSWGSFVLLFPLIYHYDSTIYYIGQLVDYSFGPINEILQSSVLIALVSLLILSNALLLKKGAIKLSDFKEELIQLMALCILYLTTPLLVGFSIYFVFWHSLDAMKDQLDFLKRSTPDYTINNYIRDILPFSLIAISSVSVLSYYLMINTGVNFFSLLFVLIAIITLPHILLFEKMYSEKNTSNS